VDALLEALETEDPGLLVLAIEQAGSYLVVHMAERASVEILATALLRHIEHPRSKVRQALAEIAIHLPDAGFETAVTRLLQDPNAFVKRAATRSYDERSRKARASRDCEERSADVRRLRAQILKVHKAAGLRLADRLSDRTLTQFVNRLVHEIVKVAGPLRGAMADIQTEARAVTGNGSRLSARSDEAHAMIELLLGMALSTRAQAQETDPTFRPVNVRALVDEQVKLLQARIGDARLARLRLETDVDVNLTVEGDRVLLAQALSNLLQNAVEAYPAIGEGPITIRIRAETRNVDTLVALAVEDRGGGIDPSLIAQIGDPFTSSKGTGRGLGVLNVRRVVELVHGGTLDVRSERGVGTCMTLAIPRKQPAK
jgi:signal transduction histidine kinase